MELVRYCPFWGQWVGVGQKHDYEPLLAPGRHDMTLPEVWSRFVAVFNEAPARAAVYWKLEQVVQDLLFAGLPCDVWLDGSLLTGKPEPGDLDITIVIDEEVLDSASDSQSQLIDKLANAEYQDGVDSFVLTRWRRDNPIFGTELDDLATWNEVYGAEHSKEWLKGFVVLRLNETDVGILLRRG